MEGLTQQIGTFIAAMPSTGLPQECVELARSGIVDCIGVLIAGADEPAPSLVASLVSECPSASMTGGAPVIPAGWYASAVEAALINGTSAHVLDYDDVALAGHPSAVLAPAILAEGWALGCSGKDLLSAYVTGYETWALLVKLEPGSHHDLGFHPTAVHGALATAAACARLHRLDPTQSAHAVALSASMAAGLVANFGTMTKSFHVGRAAQTGVIASRLAAKGFTASLDALERPTGFLRAHSPTGKPDLRDTDHKLGVDWQLPKIGIHIKRYPICYATHRSIDAMLELIAQYDLKPADVASIHVRVGETQRLMLRNHEPKTGLEAKFSIEFAMASALSVRRVGLRELSDEFVLLPQTQELMHRVECTTTSELITDWDQPYAPFDTVSVVLQSGRILKAEPVRYPKGSWQRPMTKDELQAKFLDCANMRLDGAQSARLFEQLWELNSVDSVRNLELLLRDAGQVSVSA